MSVINCPLGKLCCDGCNQLTTGGCLAKQTSYAHSITHDDMVEMYDRRREELMKLSKEELVEMLIGKREHVGMTFG